MSLPRLVAFLVAAALLVALFAIAERQGTAPLADRLSADGATTLARVTRLTPLDHNYVYYDFTIDGHAYTGWGNVGPGNPAAEQLHIGDSVVITYVRSEPALSLLGNRLPPRSP